MCAYGCLTYRGFTPREWPRWRGFPWQWAAGTGVIVRQSSRFLIHAAFHERAPLQKMDRRVFFFGLRLALSLKLSHSRALSRGSHHFLITNFAARRSMRRICR
jgi:hypothetical protein